MVILLLQHRIDQLVRLLSYPSLKFNSDSRLPSQLFKLRFQIIRFVFTALLSVRRRQSFAWHLVSSDASCVLLLSKSALIFHQLQQPPATIYRPSTYKE